MKEEDKNSDYLEYIKNKEKEESENIIRGVLIVIAVFCALGFACYITNMMGIFLFIVVLLGVNSAIAVWGPPTGDGW